MTVRSIALRNNYKFLNNNGATAMCVSTRRTYSYLEKLPSRNWWKNRQLISILKLAVQPIW